MKSLDTASEPELVALSGKDGPLACKWCAKCGHHYRFCKCEHPEWKCRSNGILGPMPGEAGGPDTLMTFLAHGTIAP